MTIRTYSELSRLSKFEDRYHYLELRGAVGSATFGFDRYLNQRFYTSREWKDTREEIIIRDNGCDLGVEGYEIYDKILIHHMNPLRKTDLTRFNPDIMNPEYLICVTHRTHNAIHYGDEGQLLTLPKERTSRDTILW